MKTREVDKIHNDQPLQTEYENPSNEVIIARLRSAMKKIIEKYGMDAINKPIERKLMFYKGWPKEDQ